MWIPPISLRKECSIVCTAVRVIFNLADLNGKNTNKTLELLSESLNYMSGKLTCMQYSSFKTVGFKRKNMNTNWTLLLNMDDLIQIELLVSVTKNKKCSAL